MNQKPGSGTSAGFFKLQDWKEQSQQSQKTKLFINPEDLKIKVVIGKD